MKKHKLISLLGCHQSSQLDLALKTPHVMPRGSSSPFAALLLCSSAGVPCYINFIPACPSTVGIWRQQCALCLYECAQETLGYLGNSGDTESPPPETQTKNPCPLENPIPRPAIPSSLHGGGR